MNRFSRFDKYKLKMEIGIGNDHTGVKYKNKIIEFLKTKNYDIVNFGTDSEESVDYPDYVHPVSNFVEKRINNIGILICGSANGVAMTANKHRKIRAALCWNREITKLSRQHNNANIICIPARFVSVDDAIEMVEIFVATEFEGGRHNKRVNKIPCD